MIGKLKIFYLNLKYTCIPFTYYFLKVDKVINAYQIKDVLNIIFFVQILVLFYF